MVLLEKVPSIRVPWCGVPASRTWGFQVHSGYHQLSFSNRILHDWRTGCSEMLVSQPSTLLEGNSPANTQHMRGIKLANLMAAGDTVADSNRRLLLMSQAAGAIIHCQLNCNKKICTVPSTKVSSEIEADLLLLILLAVSPWSRSFCIQSLRRLPEASSLSSRDCQTPVGVSRCVVVCMAVQ